MNTASKSLSRRQFLHMAAGMAAGVVVSACSPSAPGTPQKETGPVKETVVVQEVKVETKVVEVEKPVRDTGLPFKYRPMGQPNNGEPIKLTFWDWTSTRMKLFERWFPRYTEAHPNVTFETAVVPWSEYWTKLQASIPAGQAPDMHFHHWGQSDVFAWGGLLESFPEELFPPSELEQTFDSLKTWQGPEGRYYWLPTGMMSGMIFYNKDMFAEEGVTEADFPKTWDALLDLAKRLTTYDSSGRVDRSGYNINGFEDGTLKPMIRQKGCWIWNQEKTRACYNQQEIVDSLQWLVDLKEVHRVTEPDFLGWSESFAAGKAAMMLGWNWVAGNLKVNNPDIKFGTFTIPTWSGEFPPCAAEGSPDPASVVVASTTPADRKSVAFDVIAWLYSNPDFLIDNCLTFAVGPTTPQLGNHPLLMADETIATYNKQRDWVMAGITGIPLEGTIGAKWLRDGVFKENMPVREALANCQEEMDQAVKDFLDEQGLESVRFFGHEYKHADLMHWSECLS